METKKQERVFANLERVSSDGSRHETRFELDGENVSPQVRALIKKGRIVVGDAGSLTRSVAPRHVEPELKQDTLHEIRAALLGAPPTVRRYASPRSQSGGR